MSNEEITIHKENVNKSYDHIAGLQGYEIIDKSTWLKLIVDLKKNGPLVV
jgi:hypothetical protein